MTVLPRRDDRFRPLAVLRERPVGVRLIAEAMRVEGRGSRARTACPLTINVGFFTPNLRTARSAADFIHCFERSHKLLLERVPLGAIDFDVEGMTEEVVRTGVFVEAADEVTDGVRKILLAARRCIEEHVAR